MTPMNPLAIAPVVTAPASVAPWGLWGAWVPWGPWSSWGSWSAWALWDPRGFWGPAGAPDASPEMHLAFALAFGLMVAGAGALAFRWSRSTS